MNKPIFELDGKRVWIAGSRGLVGSACMQKFRHENCFLIPDPHRRELDLRNGVKTDHFIAQTKPDLIILAAAKVGGIADNAAHQDMFYDDNIQIQNSVIDAAAKRGVSKLVFLGSSCIYPRDCPQPMREDYLSTGDLEPTNQSYARAKIAGIEKINELHDLGHDFISLMPCNLYGDQDHFIDGLRPHVIPALMYKFLNAGDNDVTVWGSGKPLREFMHVDDLADGLVHAVKHYNGKGHINIGSGEEITIAQLVSMIANISRFKGNIIFDPSMPDGTPRKIMDSSQFYNLGWKPKISLLMGLQSVWTSLLNQGQREGCQHG